MPFLHFRFLSEFSIPDSISRPSRIQWTHQPIRNENSEFTREFCMVTHFGFQKSRQAEFSRPVIVIPRQHAPPRSRAPATRAHAHNLIQGRHMGRISHQNRTKKSCINAIRYAMRSASARGFWRCTTWLGRPPLGLERGRKRRLSLICYGVGSSIHATKRQIIQYDLGK